MVWTAVGLTSTSGDGSGRRGAGRSGPNSYFSPSLGTTVGWVVAFRFGAGAGAGRRYGGWVGFYEPAAAFVRPGLAPPTSPLMTSRFVFFVLVIFGLPALLPAQSCDFQLILEDSFGDGWNGAEVIVRVNGVATGYTISRDQVDFARYFIPVTTGDAIELDYEAGGFPIENSWRLLDNDDQLLFESFASTPSTVNIFDTTAVCAFCAPPPLSSIEVRRVRATSAEVKFRSVPADREPLYRILYGPPAFDPAADPNPGTELTTTDTLVRITDLVPETGYDFYVGAICRAGESNDTTSLRGPFQIMTQKRVDVGVTAIPSPNSGCGLGGQPITIGITNFGGEPQAFFEVDFSINGDASGIPRPADGIFTGIVGVDSTEFFTFDARAFLDIPGEYTFSAWTQLEEDEVLANDTLTITVFSVPVIEDFPYVENFEEDNGFWGVVAEGEGAASWEWGEPTGTRFDRAPQGRNAWGTNLGGEHNNQEVSYLVTPCFDLSTMVDDPLFTVQLGIDTETSFDALTVEFTTDGENWTKIETGPTTVNWYNDLVDQLYEGDGGFDGIATVQALVDGVAGAERMQLRFAFTSDFSVTNEGVLLDAFVLTERADNNLAAAQLSSTNTAACGTPTDTLAFRITNVGTNTVSDFPVSYQVNDGPVVTETFPGNLRGGATVTYRFTTPFDATGTTENTIRAWTDLPGDFQLSNDTTVYFQRITEDIPFFEDFSAGSLPRGWTVETQARVGDREDSGDPNLFENIFSGRENLIFSTAKYGQVMMGDSLLFKLRQAEFGGAEPPYVDTSLLTLTFIVNCTDSIVMPTIRLAGDTCVRMPLDQFAGQDIQVRFDLEWLSGDFWAYFDDIGIKRCPPNLELSAAVRDATRQEEGSASIAVGNGLAPFTYEWTVPNVGATATDLPVGSYTVTVTDGTGCADVVTFTVDLDTRADDPGGLLGELRVFPNPAAGAVQLQADLPRATRLRYDLFDLNGRRLLAADLGRLPVLDERIDLTGLPTGTYLLRVQTDDGARTIRVVKRR